MSLRDAIRENYQHNWNVPLDHRAKNGTLLQWFINGIRTIDEAATISDPEDYDDDPNATG